MPPVRVLYDTNIFISALVSNGSCRVLLHMALGKEVIAVTSPALLEELFGKLVGKFSYTQLEANAVLGDIRSSFFVVHPDFVLKIQNDDPDNRVLEAAIAGGCRYIVTGDKELLELGIYERIRIFTPRQFF